MHQVGTIAFRNEKGEFIASRPIMRDGEDNMDFSGFVAFATERLTKELNDAPIEALIEAHKEMRKLDRKRKK